MLLAVVALVTAQRGYNPTGPRIEVMLANRKSFVITTDPGTSPKTVRAILKLVRSGFYDKQKFHRVEPWIAQWGDPQSKRLPVGDSRLGTGNSGHPLPFEASKLAFERGVVGIASTRNRVGGDCQVFVVKRRAPILDGGYAVLGKITAGMDVVDHIKIGEKIDSVIVVGETRREGG